VSLYRKADIRMWGDERVRDFSVNAERVWTWLIIGPFTTVVPGLVLTTKAGFAERLRMRPRAFKDAFAEIEQVGMAEADWKAGVIVLLKAPEQEVNRPTGSNQPVEWSKFFSEFAPQCDLTRRYREAIRSLCAAVSPDYSKAFDEQSRGHYRPKNLNDPATGQTNTKTERNTDPKPQRNHSTPGSESLSGAVSDSLSQKQEAVAEAGSGQTNTHTHARAPGVARATPDQPLGSERTDPPSPATTIPEGEAAKPAPQATPKDVIPSPGAAPRPVPAPSFGEEVAAFRCNWGEFYKLATDPDDNAWETAWRRIVDTAGIAKVDRWTYATTAMQAFRDWGATYSNNFTWAAEPALFVKHFGKVVSWMREARSSGAAPPQQTPRAAAAAPVVRHGSTRLADENPELVERARVLELQAAERRRKREAEQSTAFACSTGHEGPARAFPPESGGHAE
jgi:hypothetical protein